MRRDSAIPVHPLAVLGGSSYECAWRIFGLFLNVTVVFKACRLFPDIYTRTYRHSPQCLFFFPQTKAFHSARRGSPCGAGVLGRGHGGRRREGSEFCVRFAAKMQLGAMRLRGGERKQPLPHHLHRDVVCTPAEEKTSAAHNRQADLDSLDADRSVDALLAFSAEGLSEALARNVESSNPRSGRDRKRYNVSLHVDPDSGHDETGDGTSTLPFASILGALTRGVAMHKCCAIVLASGKTFTGRKNRRINLALAAGQQLCLTTSRAQLPLDAMQDDDNASGSSGGGSAIVDGEGHGFLLKLTGGKQSELRIEGLIFQNAGSALQVCGNATGEYFSTSNASTLVPVTQVHLSTLRSGNATVRAANCICTTSKVGTLVPVKQVH